MWGSGNAPRGADRAIKHPGRNLQPPIGGVARETAAENLPVSLFDHLMNVNARVPRSRGRSLVVLYNTARPHSSLGYQTPAAFAEVFTAIGSDAALNEGFASPTVAQPAPYGVTETAKALVAAG